MSDLKKGYETTALTPRNRSVTNHPAWQTATATIICTALVGGGGAVVRSKDIDRIEKRQDGIEYITTNSTNQLIELRSDLKYQRESIERIEHGMEQLNTKIDIIKDKGQNR